MKIIEISMEQAREIWPDKQEEPAEAAQPEDPAVQVIDPFVIADKMFRKTITLTARNDGRLVGREAKRIRKAQKAFRSDTIRMAKKALGVNKLTPEQFQHIKSQSFQVTFA